MLLPLAPFRDVESKPTIEFHRRRQITGYQSNHIQFECHDFVPFLFHQMREKFNALLSSTSCSYGTAERMRESYRFVRILSKMCADLNKPRKRFRETLAMVRPKKFYNAVGNYLKVFAISSRSKAEMAFKDL